MINTSAQVLAAENGPFAIMRTGTVSTFAPNQLVINVGGTTYPSSYRDGDTFSPGDLIVALNQDATWFVLGRIAGVGVNLLAGFNPSFEVSEPGTFPSSWFFADISGSSSAAVMAFSPAPDGAQVAAVTSDGTPSQSYLYSSPIAAAAGDQFTVSAYVGGLYDITDTHTADAAIVATWYANDTNLYPTTSSPDQVISTAVDVAAAPPFTTLSGTITAPVTGFLRVALRSDLTATQRLMWDNVILRAA
jgi:hypothetical protein